jgi:hypothetical protein
MLSSERPLAFRKKKVLREKDETYPLVISDIVNWHITILKRYYEIVEWSI